MSIFVMTLVAAGLPPNGERPASRLMQQSYKLR